MKKNKIKSVMVTSINLDRWELITKEKMQSYCTGKNYEKDSVNNDLESLFKNIRLGNYIFGSLDEKVLTYFLPKLTEEELELVERKAKSYLQTFFYDDEADVDETEMMLSESDSKYVRGESFRRTFVIDTDPFGPSMETSGYESSGKTAWEDFEGEIVNLSTFKLECMQSSNVVRPVGECEISSIAHENGTPHLRKGNLERR